MQDFLLNAGVLYEPERSVQMEYVYHFYCNDPSVLAKQEGISSINCRERELILCASRAVFFHACTAWSQKAKCQL